MEALHRLSRRHSSGRLYSCSEYPELGYARPRSFWSLQVKPDVPGDAGGLTRPEEGVTRESSAKGSKLRRDDVAHVGGAPEFRRFGEQSGTARQSCPDHESARGAPD